eukprot:766410-Hanusia_phi.AAC.2
MDHDMLASLQLNRNKQKEKLYEIVKEAVAPVLQSSSQDRATLISQLNVLQLRYDVKPSEDVCEVPSDSLAGGASRERRPAEEDGGDKSDTPARVAILRATCLSPPDLAARGTASECYSNAGKRCADEMFDLCSACLVVLSESVLTLFLGPPARSLRYTTGSNIMNEFIP